MCAYVNEITDVVNDFVNSGSMFTAFDVTLALRKKSRQNIQHYEVKREVHNMFQGGQMFSYDRALADLPNVNPQPWVYHPLSADPTLYSGVPTAVASAVAPVPTIPNSSIATVDDDDGVLDLGDDGSDVAADGTTVYKFDTTDRLCVPNKLVRQLGLKNGDNAVVYSEPNNVTVVSENAAGPAGASAVASYVVDRYDNVRMSRALFSKLGISAVAFEIEGDNTAIKVKKYA